jgi:hypothetical protein
MRDAATPKMALNVEVNAVVQLYRTRFPEH